MNSRIPESLSTPMINSVLHAADILGCYVSRQEEYLSLVELCQLTGIPKTTVYRLVRTLQSVGWIEQSEINGKYRLGTELLLLASAVSLHTTARHLILEEMRKLSAMYEENIVLSSLRGNTGICLDVLESGHRFSAIPKRGHSVPLHSGAAGKALLAAQPSSEIERILAMFPEEFARKLGIQLKEIERVGYCISESEVDVGTTVIAVPLCMTDGNYSLSILGPAEEMQQLGYDVLKEALQNAVDRIRQKERVI